MVLGEVVGLVQTAFLPVDVELTLADAVADPVKPHVDGFGALLFDRVIGDAGGGAVVGLDGRRWLWVTEFFEGGADGARFFAVVEQSGEFGFGGA